MPVTLEPLPPLEAILAMARRGRRLDPTFSWRDMWQREHLRAFTVAKSAGFDILEDIQKALQEALEQGLTPRQFAQRLEPILREKGWWGRRLATDPLTGIERVVQLGSTRRLDLIFDTNMRVSYARGHWQGFERRKRDRPWLRYVALLDDRTRHAHRRMHNVTLPVDDPWWETFAPPNGWNCRCTLMSLSDRDVERMRDELIFEPPEATWRDIANPRTGEVTRTPDGVDPGWAYNPGREASKNRENQASGP